MDLFKSKKKKDRPTAAQQPVMHKPAPLVQPNQTQPWINGSGASSPSVDADGWQRIASTKDENRDSSNSRGRQSDLDSFTKLLEGNIPLATMPEAMTKHALELEQDIIDYLHCNNAETHEKHLIAQDVLRFGLEKSPELVDEAYLQTIKQMQGKTTTSVRGWELLLLLACASRPSARYLEGINGFVHAAAHATTQWPTTTSILARRTWNTLKHNTKAGRRVNVPLVGEIASVLNNKTLRVQVTFVDGSNKWLSYDWTTTVSGAVEQLANEIGLKNYQEYTLFEARKVPKKLDKEGNFSTATLPPDHYLLLEDHRRIADVVHDYEARGAENKLLLKRRRFDSTGADFSKPQFLALIETHQTAMDEKVAEVANLTLRLREMSGQVMWFENIQSEKAAEISGLKAELQQLKSNSAHPKSLDPEEGKQQNETLKKERDKLMQEKDELIEQLKQLKAGELMTEALSDKNQPRVVYEAGSDRTEFEELKRQLDLRNTEILNIKAAYQNADRILMSSDHQHEAELAQMEMVLAEKTKDVEELNQLVNKLTSQLDHLEHDEEHKGITSSWHSGVKRSFSSPGELAKGEGDSELEKQLSTMQDKFQRQTELREELEVELDRTHQDLQDKEEWLKKHEKAWRSQVNAARAETATVRSRLKANEAALLQATNELEQLHADSGQLRMELETKEQENEALTARLRDTEAQGFAGGSDSGRSLADADLIETLRTELEDVANERDVALEKLTVIQSFMSGSILNTTNSNPGSERSQRRQTMQHQSRQSFDSNSDLSEQRLDMRNRRKAQKVIVDPLSIGRDPRRESIGGASAPVHLRHAAPLRVLPEEQRAYGTRHPLFTPNYVQQLPLMAANNSRREDHALRKEAAAMLSAADAKRRTFKHQDLHGEALRPAPAAATSAHITNNINKGTHLLGLLNRSITASSQEAAHDDLRRPDTARGYRERDPAKEGKNSRKKKGKGKSSGAAAREVSLHSTLQSQHSMTSTQSEPDLMRSYDVAKQAPQSQ